RDLHRSLEYRDDLPGSPFLPRAGDDAGSVPEHDPAGRAGVVRPVHGGRLAVRGVAGSVAARPGGGLAGEERRDLLAGDHGRAARVLGRMGFRDPRSSRGLSETRRSATADPPQWPGPGGVRRAAGPLSVASKGVATVARRVRAIGLRAARIRALEWEKVELRAC